MSETISERKFERLRFEGESIKKIKNKAVSRECDECLITFKWDEEIIRVLYAGKPDAGYPPEFRYFHIDCYNKLYKTTSEEIRMSESLKEALENHLDDLNLFLKRLEFKAKNGTVSFEDVHKLVELYNDLETLKMILDRAIITS